MSLPPSRRAGLAIIRIEFDAEAPDRITISLRTVEPLGPDPPVERVFTSCEPLLEYLRAWVEDATR